MTSNITNSSSPALLTLEAFDRLISEANEALGFDEDVGAPDPDFEPITRQEVLTHLLHGPDYAAGAFFRNDWLQDVATAIGGEIMKQLYTLEPFSPWLGLTRQDVHAMVDGREGRGGRYGLVGLTTSRWQVEADEPLTLSELLLADRHREWLMKRAHKLKERGSGLLRDAA